MDQGKNGTTQTQAEAVEAVAAVATRTLDSYRRALQELARQRAQSRALAARARNHERIARKAVRLFRQIRPRLRTEERLRREAEHRARAADERARQCEQRALAAERRVEELQQNGAGTRSIERIERRLTAIGRDVGRRA